METTENTAALDEAKQIIINQKFVVQENNLLKQENTVRLLREFFAKHHDEIAAFGWRCYGWEPSIVFDNYDQNPKEIARAFGSDGWVRQHDGHSCGSINWTKTVDNIELRIEGAENIKPKLIDVVKF